MYLAMTLADITIGGKSAGEFEKTELVPSKQTSRSQFLLPSASTTAAAISIDQSIYPIYFTARTPAVTMASSYFRT